APEEIRHADAVGHEHTSLHGLAVVPDHRKPAAHREGRHLSPLDSEDCAERSQNGLGALGTRDRKASSMSAATRISRHRTCTPEGTGCLFRLAPAQLTPSFHRVLLSIRTVNS